MESNLLKSSARSSGNTDDISVSMCKVALYACSSASRKDIWLFIRLLHHFKINATIKNPAKCGIHVVIRYLQPKILQMQTDFVNTVVYTEKCHEWTFNMGIALHI